MRLRGFLRVVLVALLPVLFVSLSGCGSRHAGGGGLCPAFDFVAGFAQAESRPETRRLDLGTEVARRDLLSGWSVDETWEIGKTSFVWGVGSASSLRVYRFSSRPARLRFRCRPLIWPNAPTQVVTTFVNGAQVGETRLAPEEFGAYDLVIPGANFVAGENMIEFRYSRHGFPPESSGGRVEKRPLAVAWDGISLGDTGDTGAETGTEPGEAVAGRAAAVSATALLLPFRSRLDYFVPLSPGSRLRLGGVHAWGSGRLSGAARLEVQVHWGDGPRESRSFEVDPAQLAGSPVEVDLPPRGFPVARISFLALPGVSHPSQPTPAPGGLALVRPQLLDRLACGARRKTPQAIPAKTAGPRPNILVYLVDTLRADHLGIYGASRTASAPASPGVSPNIDRFGAEGVVFTHAFAQSGWTRSSVTSILTGLSPLVHRVLLRSDALPESLPTLQSLLHGAGYETVGIVTNPTVSTDFGFAHGFDRFVPLDREQSAGGLAPTADRVDDEFLAWLRARKSAAPFFAYLHTMDPHDPYTPREPYRSRFAPRRRTALDSPRHEAMMAALARHPELSEEDLKGDLAGLYDAEIAFNDEQFGRLLGELRRASLYENTLIVFVSDHGEEFHDHGFWGHGHSLYAEILRIPLLLKLPGRARARKLDLSVEHIDLLPTLLAAAGVRPPAGLSGKNLLPLIAGSAGSAEGDAGAAVDRPILSYLRVDAYDLISLVSGGKHLLSRTPEHPEAQLEIYDLQSDPRELQDIASEKKLWAGHLLGLLRAELARTRRGSQAPTARIPKETEDRLRALGYVH